MNMTGEVAISSEADLARELGVLARTQRMVFFAGLPGVGKSLFIRELARTAHTAGRQVHLLQWDVVRPAFVTPEIDARYPQIDGVTHAMIRKAVGRWSRGAVLRWHRQHDAAHILIGEVPLVGCRLLDLVQSIADDAEALLAGPDVLFATPVPSEALRYVIENARGRTFANPANPREGEDAPPALLKRAWQELHGHALSIGATRATDAEAAFDPEVYAAAHRHLLRHRHNLTIRMNAQLRSRQSVYDLDFAARELVPQQGEAADIVAQLERDFSPDEIEREVAAWFERV
jgi:hypothetical protein